MESALEYFLSTLHQDFADDHGDVWGAVDAFVRDEPGEARRIPAEVNQLLATDPTEGQLDSYLDRLGCEYFASPETGGYRTWLAEVGRRVEAAIS